MDTKKLGNAEFFWYPIISRLIRVLLQEGTFAIQPNLPFHKQSNG